MKNYCWILLLLSSISVEAQYYTVNPNQTTLISVKAYGATGNGSTVDGTAIGAAITANPTATIFFPPGTYLLNNASGATGLNISSSFSGRLLFASGATLSCNTATTSAGVCVNISSSTFISDGMTITYTGIGSLPLTRANSTNYALLTGAATSGGATNVTFLNTTVLASTGPCIWASNTNGITFINTSVNKCTADALDLTNDSNATVSGYWDAGSGDDGFSILSPTGQTQVCGTTANNIHIQNASARGISIVGGCNVAISDFDINTTGVSAIYVEAESGYNTPTQNVKFSNGFVTAAGSINPGFGNEFCAEINTANNVTIDGVQCKTGSSDGFNVNGASYVKINNSLVTGTSGYGFNIIGCTHCDFVGDRADTTTSLGWYSTTSSDVTVSNLVLRDVNTSNVGTTNEAAFNASESGPVIMHGIELIDDQTTPTGLTIGGSGNGSNSIIVDGIRANITNGIYYTTYGSATESYTMAGQPSFSYAAGGGTANAQTVNFPNNNINLWGGTGYGGNVVSWLPTAANTGATTLQLNGSTPAENLVKYAGQTLAAGDLLPTVVATAIWDGTNFELQNPQSVSDTLASIHQTGKTASITTATLCAASAGACNVAGQYEINISMIGTGTACSSPGTTKGVYPTISWTDTNGTARSIAPLLQSNNASPSALAYVQTGITFTTSLASEQANGTFVISTNGSVIQYSTTYTACTTGTGTYQLDMAVNRLQ